MNQALDLLPTLADEQSRLQHWLNSHSFSPIECDCINAVMLKILDGKCKMAALEKITMEALYRVCRHLPALHLGEDYHNFIGLFLDTDREQIAEQDILAIYEKRVLAETQISRPVMKKFKQRLRQEGALPPKTKDQKESD